MIDKDDKVIVIGAGDIGKTTIAEQLKEKHPNLIIVDDVESAKELLKSEYHKEAVYKYENIVRPYEDVYGHQMTKKERNAPDMEPVRSTPKIYNNEPCPCGSGKKYKKCCK